MEEPRMAEVVGGPLIELLACPDCGGDLRSTSGRLECIVCGGEFEVRNGIPLLYPRRMDPQHLQGEEELARMMQLPPSTPKERFISSQWEASKREFWRLVSDTLASPPASIINIGCGYDATCLEFQRRGYLFVNFDIVYDMLSTLRTRDGAEWCVAGDIGALPLKGNAFDALVCIDVIHHEGERTEALLKSFRDVLKTGGTVFLQDVNAWGMFQMPKSLLLPKPVYRALREAYHSVRHSTHRPAEYEFPTSVWRTKDTLSRLGFSRITAHPHTAYPCVGERAYALYRLFSRLGWVGKHHNYHYTLSATKS
jgi:SAM-dependent methyltransferase